MTLSNGSTSLPLSHTLIKGNLAMRDVSEGERCQSYPCGPLQGEPVRHCDKTVDRDQSWLRRAGTIILHNFAFISNFVKKLYAHAVDFGRFLPDVVM